MAQHARLGDQRRGGDLGDHEAGVEARVLRQEGRQSAQRRVHQLLHPPLADGRELGAGDGQHVEGERDRLAVEVAARDDEVLVGEDQRVVGGRVHLDGQDAPGVLQAVAHRPVHLGHAAERVRVLDLGAVGVALDDLRVAEQRAQVLGDGHLARVRPRGVDRGEEGPVAPEQPLEGHRPGQVRGLGQRLAAEERQRAHRAHRLGAVHQRQALLGLEHHRLEPGAGQRGASGEPLVADEGLALADEHQRQVGQRREVARGAHAAALGDDRDDAAVQHVERELERAGAGCRSAPWRARCSAGGAAPAPRGRAAASRRRRRGRGGGCAGASGGPSGRCAPRPGCRSRC